MQKKKILIILPLIYNLPLQNKMRFYFSILIPMIFNSKRFKEISMELIDIPLPEWETTTLIYSQK